MSYQGNYPNVPGYTSQQSNAYIPAYSQHNFQECQGAYCTADYQAGPGQQQQLYGYDPYAQPVAQPPYQPCTQSVGSNGYPHAHPLPQSGAAQHAPWHQQQPHASYHTAQAYVNSIPYGQWPTLPGPSAAHTASQIGYMHAPGAVQESAPWQSSYPYGSTTSTTASQAVAAVPAAGAHNHSGTAATGDSAGKNDTGDDAYDPTADVDPVEPSIAPWQPPTPASLADHNHLQETQEQQHCAAGYVDSKGQPTHSAHLTPHAGTALGFTATEAAPNAKRQRTEGPRQEHAAHCHANRSMTPGASASMQEKSPPERLQPVHVVLVWDLDETLILFNSLMSGAYDAALPAAAVQGAASLAAAATVHGSKAEAIAASAEAGARAAAAAAGNAALAGTQSAVPTAARTQPTPAGAPQVPPQGVMLGRRMRTMVQYLLDMHMCFDELDAVDPISWADLARMASEADASVHASAATAAAGSATAAPPPGAVHALTDDLHRHPHAHVPTDQAYLVQHPEQPCITTAQHTSNTTAQQAALPPKPHVKLPQPKGLSACMAKVEAVYKAGSQGLPFSPPQLEALCKLIEATDSYTEGWRSHAVSLLQALQETPQQAAYQAPAREAYTAVAAAAANTSSADGIGSATTQTNGERSERNDAELYPLKMQQVLSHSVSGHWFGAVERVSHVLVTNSHLVAALGKLLLFGLDRFFPLSHVYSASARLDKLPCFQAVHDHFQSSTPSPSSNPSCCTGKVLQAQSGGAEETAGPIPPSVANLQGDKPTDPRVIFYALGDSFEERIAAAALGWGFQPIDFAAAASIPTKASKARAIHSATDSVSIPPAQPTVISEAAGLELGHLDDAAGKVHTPLAVRISNAAVAEAKGGCAAPDAPVTLLKLTAQCIMQRVAASCVAGDAGCTSA